MILAAAGACERPVGQSLQGAGMGDREALRQRQLIGGDRQAVQRGHERQLARARALGAFEPFERRLQSRRADLEVGLLVEHVRQQRPDRGPRA